MTVQPGSDGLRASDAERERVVAHLRDACADGRITLEELTERAESAYTATTRGELTRLTADLPAHEQRHEQPVRPGPGSAERRMVAILGDVSRAGRWAAEGSLQVIAVLGDVKLDMREAYVPAQGVTINAIAVLGDVKILVPEGVRVELEGTAVLGDKSVDVVPPPALAPAPTVRVRANALLGDVRVSNTPRRGLVNRLFGT